MADQAVILDVALSDPTTPSQQAAVSAGGALSVSLTASSATVTVDTELPAAAALADGAAATPTTVTVGAASLIYNGTTLDRQRSVIAAQDSTGTGIAAAGILGQLDDVATAAVTENQFAPLRISTRRALLIEGVASGTVVPVSLTSTTITGTVTVDTELPTAAALSDAFANPTAPGVGAFLMGWNSATWDRLKSTTANGLVVDVSRVQGTVTTSLASTTITGTVTVDTEMPAAAALADATANPTTPSTGSLLMAYNGTTWDRVRSANTGRLQVDVITGGGTDTPTTPITKYATNAAQAAAATFDFDSVSQTSATTKLTKVIWSSSVATKAEIKAVSNSVATSYGVGFALAGTVGVWEPPSGRSGRAYMSITFSGGGTNVWRVTVTNRDPSQAADTYCTIFYEN